MRNTSKSLLSCTYLEVKGDGTQCVVSVPFSCCVSIFLTDSSIVKTQKYALSRLSSSQVCKSAIFGAQKAREFSNFGRLVVRYFGCLVVKCFGCLVVKCFGCLVV